jgi:hypothetical protein
VIVLKPFQKEWECCDTDVVNSVCCHFVPEIIGESRAGPSNRGRWAAQLHNPVTKRMPVVRRLRCDVFVYQEGGKCERRADEAEEDDSLLSHRGSVT